MNTLSNIFDYIYDLPTYRRMLCFFLFAGSISVSIYLVIGSVAVALNFMSMSFMLAGAIGNFIGCGLVNMVALELLENKSN